MTTAENPIRVTDPPGRRRQRPALVLVATSVLLLACLVSSASASAAPANDDFANATTISTLPFSTTVDVTDATLESGEPQFCYGSSQSVWYAYTPAHDGHVSITTTGSVANGQVTAYRADASGFGGLSYETCENFGFGSPVFEVQAGTTYYLQLSPAFGGGGTLQLHVDELLPPANDDFADAKPIGAVPFFASFDLRAATVEDNEPTTCQGLSSSATAWYAFTPAVSGSYLVSRPGEGPVAVYTGTSLPGLTQVTCGRYQAVFHADAGTTYHLQAASDGFGYAGIGQLAVERAPDPQASFFYWPADPSVFDTVSFTDASYDFAGIGSRSWHLGDGFTSTAAEFGHRFAADGSYAAKLDIRTSDGRTASQTQTVAVTTHDVAIASMTVPAQGRAGKTKQIAIGVNNSRYPETVRVSIQRSVAGGGFEEVGQVTQSVPARAARKKTNFEISYTFSEQDASFGKVTFQAVATTLTARDANPSDNTVIAPATKVKP
jgi:hypothetical protein